MPTLSRITAQIRFYWLGLLTAMLVLGQPGIAVADSAENFVRGLADDVIFILRDTTITEDQFIAEFRSFIELGFDVPIVGRFALGPYWRTASEEQRQEYLTVFTDYIVNTYATRFRQYSGESFEVGGTREINDSETIVTSTIIRPKKEDISVDWHVRDNNGTYKIIDILFEGLRLGLSLRDEFSSVIRAGGGNLQVLIDDLRNRQLGST